jgi:F-type H+-transporting ATPase subunit epsilon
MTRLNCTVVTPEETTLDEQVEFVALPLYDGEIGIAFNHTPLVGRLGYGEMRLRSGDKVSRFYVDGGFVQVIDNQITVLTSRAVAAGEIDSDSAEQQLAAALQRPANTPELLEIRDRLVSQARGQLRVARRSEQ